MKTISSLSDLRQFGIYPLTAEADNLSYRILCDLSEKGKEIIEEVYCVTCNSGPWNNETDGNKHVNSVMLTHRAWEDIAPIALLTCHTIVKTEYTFFGFENEEVFISPKWGYLDTKKEELVVIEEPKYSRKGRELRTFPRCYGKIERLFKHSSHPHSGTRNIHALTERIY